MKLNIKNKKIIIFCIAVLIVVVIGGGIYFYKRSYSEKNNLLKDNAYIDIWRDKSMDMDIDLYSTGSGANEKLYLGVQPVHYLINKNGNIYTCQDSSYQNKMTGKRDPATVKYIKQLSQSDLEKLENDLKSIIENNSSNSVSLTSTYWYIKVNGKATRVNANIQTQILNNYL